MGVPHIVSLGYRCWTCWRQFRVRVYGVAPETIECPFGCSTRAHLLRDNEARREQWRVVQMSKVS